MARDGGEIGLGRKMCGWVGGHNTMLASDVLDQIGAGGMADMKMSTRVELRVGGEMVN